MNLKVLINPAEAEGHPWEMFFVGVVYALVSVWISKWLFSEYASIIMVAVTVVAALPIVYKIISFEARKDRDEQKEYNLLHEHEKAVKVLTFLFLGFVAGYTLWFVFPSQATAQDLFSAQINTILEINSPSATGQFFKFGSITDIFMNNVRILAICIVLSLFFGAGALLVLSWNASVMATAIGTVIREKLATSSTYFHIVSLSLVKYLLHGIPEITAYFGGALAGGIVYHAVLKQRMDKHVMWDVTLLVFISVVILFLATILEVHLTPLVLRGF